ncbi:MAG: hypothetical protein LC624_01425 [Halobacteriales archaeon]|nr:hypothetical protein [Halobacteriales archaeon]
MPAGLALFTVLTGLLAVVALERSSLARAGLWPHAYFLAISAQWAALGLACVGLCMRSARPPLRVAGRARLGRKAHTIVALVLFHGLMALASLLMGFADALVGGQRLPGYLVDLLPREGQLLLLLACTWGVMVVAACFLWLGTRQPGLRVAHHAPVVAVSLLTGAVAYWGWGWSRFYSTSPGTWFSLWHVGAANIAVDGSIFSALLVVLPLVHAACVVWLVARVLRHPEQAAARPARLAAP